MFGLFENKRAQFSEPVVAYKYWNTTWQGRLKSPVFSGRTPWPPGSPAVAVCRFCKHQLSFFEDKTIPFSNCTCGIYAYGKNHPEFLRCLEFGIHPGVQQVYGLVYLWGKIIVCEAGYKAQYAYPKAFIYDPNIEGSLEKIRKSANLYGAEIVPVERVKFVTRSTNRENRTASNWLP